jgi:2,3-diaminopropionate biosynthesis protein SbnB
MRDGDIIVLKGHEVLSLLTGCEEQVMSAVRAAYVAHADGNTSLPHSTFLHFPNVTGNRIIALPAYIGEPSNVAGVKWVSSFPANIERGLDRASAVLILSSAVTGRPEAVMEGSIISAKRTAASAALAAKNLHQEETARVGIIGCGFINFEIVRFLLIALPKLKAFTVFDISAERAGNFRYKCLQTFEGINVETAVNLQTVLQNSSLISLATTAGRPHINDLAACPPGTTILHVSLRDLTPDIILSCDNVVDDVDHVCRAQTSIHLAEQLVGNRDFIRCTLADILRGGAPARRDPQSVVVFSPFGLGILDIAVGKLIYDLSSEQKKGSVIDAFLPDTWTERAG